MNFRTFLAEYEVHVDDDGYAYDDEGNREFVGRRFRGNYFGVKAVKKSGMPETPPRREVPEADPRKVEVLTRALAARPNDFLSSILRQVREGRALTEPQKKAVRQNLYRLRMREDADLFR